MNTNLSANDLLKKVRKIEIKTRALSHQIFAGEYHSAFKGRGMAFSEVREYQYGDDVRNMDWNVTARLRSPYVKVFEEERELTVVLLVDVSRSRLFGTAGSSRKDVLAEIAAVLSFSAIINNDKVGALFFSDKVEKFIPPQKGRKHILYIIRELINFEPESKRTSIRVPLEYLTNAIKKRCTAFIISDFISNDDYRNAMTIANRKHDVVAIQVYDRRLASMPRIGLVKFRDAETGEEMYVDTSSAKVQEEQRRWWNGQCANLDEVLKKSRVDSVSISTDQDYVKALLALFSRRS